MAPPPLEDYLTLRREAGLSPKTRTQAEAALPGGWAACHIVHQPTGQVAGMGRLIGDGGWYFHVIDMAVLRQHQRRGLDDALLAALLDARCAPTRLETPTSTCSPIHPACACTSGTGSRPPPQGRWGWRCG